MARSYRTAASIANGTSYTLVLLFQAFLSLLFFVAPGHNSALASQSHQGQHLNRILASRNAHAKLSRAKFPRASADEDMAIIYGRRVSTIIEGLASTANIAAWLASLDAGGKWPDSQVNYTTGCEARRASWPAQGHWQRILVMAGAWHGGAPNTEQWTNNTELLAATRLAMSYWFNRDIGDNIACLDLGGVSPQCPCENPDNTLWNTNWYSNIILIPEFVAQTCLLLNDTLSSTEASHCAQITLRTYGTFDKDINGLGFLTGANTLDVAKISADASLLTSNPDIVSDAYRRVHEELTVRDGDKADGIRPDGSFGQHGGVLYNGNYGKDYSNDVLELEIAAAGTQFQANAASQKALEVLFEGNKWMIFSNSITDVLHWDFSAIGRMLSFPVIDNQASGSIKTNLASVLKLGTLWSSDTLKNFASDLSANSSSANAGNLIGNKMFYTNDYMVHRGINYVSTLKMYSNRTLNTECVNSQNPKGLHLSDGTLYTYLSGTEYEDIFASWDWDLIPGTTTAYKSAPLTCATASQTGVESFVGGLSDGHSGISAMRYTDPISGSLKWQKTWFFLGSSGVYHVMINILSSPSDPSTPVYSVLDQKRRSGETKIQLGGQATTSPPNNSTTTYPKASSLWHSNIGYTFSSLATSPLNIRQGPVTGDWSSIGTSTRPATTVDLWSAWLEHITPTTPVEYSIWPAVEYGDFQKKCHKSPVETIQNTQGISAIHDRKEDRIMAVFWSQGGGSFVYQSPDAAPLTISTTTAVAVTVSLKDGTIVASDPSQTLRETTLTLKYGAGRVPKCWAGKSRTKTVSITFPTGGLVGSSVTTKL